MVMVPMRIMAGSGLMEMETEQQNAIILIMMDGC